VWGGSIQANIETTSSLEKRNLSPREAFNFNVECKRLSYSECNVAKVMLERIGCRIAQELSLTVPINVQVNFNTVVDGPGRGYPTYVYIKKGKGIGFLYPAALVRQTEQLSSEAPDITLEVNSDINKWRFGVNYGAASSYDFECKWS
jgi:hypothetical protein